MLKLNPELEAGIKKIPRLPFHIPWLLPLVRPVFNLAARTKPVAGVEAVDLEYGSVRLRVLTPAGRSPECGMVWLHGGAHLAGKPNSVDDVASQFAQSLNALVVIPYYRLAPQHPFPADLEDAYQAWQCLLAKATEQSIPANKLAIVGNSAGAGLAASLVHKIHDDGGLQPAAQILFYPMLDDRTCDNSQLSGLNHYIWNNHANRVAWDAYLSPHKAGAETLPEYAAAARREDLSGLPPMWLGVAGIDLFRDEDMHYVERFKAAGGECELMVVDGAPHAFEVLVPDAEVSKSFIAGALAFLSKQFNG